MIVTKDFTFVHTAKTGGSFVINILHDMFDGRSVGKTFHTTRRDAKHNHPIFIGTVRNPFDWYVSMYHFYEEKQNPIIGGLGDFKNTISTLLNLHGTPKHKELKTCNLCDNAVGLHFAGGDRLIPRGGYTNQDFIDYPRNIGFYSWMWKRMNVSENNEIDGMHIMRTENLNNDLVYALEKFSKVSESQKNEILTLPKVNTTDRKHYREYYDQELIDLVYEKDSYIIKKFGYEF